MISSDVNASNECTRSRPTPVHWGRYFDSRVGHATCASFMRSKPRTRTHRCRGRVMCGSLLRALQKRRYRRGFSERIGAGLSHFANSLNDSGFRPCVRANDSTSRWCEERHQFTGSVGKSDWPCVVIFYCSPHASLCVHSRGRKLTDEGGRGNVHAPPCTTRQTMRGRRTERFRPVRIAQLARP